MVTIKIKRNRIIELFDGENKTQNIVFHLLLFLLISQTVEVSFSLEHLTKEQRLFWSN
jgi:hypothetical protein